LPDVARVLLRNLTIAALILPQPRPPMLIENDWTNRAEQIRLRLTQLQDSL